MLRAMVLAARAFGQDRRGAVAIIFALVALPLFGIVAAAIDYGRAIRLRGALQAAADAATLAASADLLRPDEAVHETVRAWLDANLPDDMRGLPYAMTVAKDRQSLSVRLDQSINTSLMAIMGLKQIDVGVTSLSRHAAAAPQLPPGIQAPSEDEMRQSIDAISRALGGAGGSFGGLAGGLPLPTAGAAGAPDHSQLSRGLGSLGVDLGGLGGTGADPAALQRQLEQQLRNTDVERQLRSLESVFRR